MSFSLDDERVQTYARDMDGALLPGPGQALSPFRQKQITYSILPAKITNNVFPLLLSKIAEFSATWHLWDCEAFIAQISLSARQQKEFTRIYVTATI